MKLLPLLLICFSSIAQDSSSYKLFSKQNKASYTAMFISGMCSGFVDAQLAYRPFRGDHNWDLYVSALNKYKNHDPLQGEAFLGSTSVFVWTTDGFHFISLQRDAFAIFSGVLSFNDLKDFKHQWKKILASIGLQYAARSLGHCATYDLILPEVKKWQ